MSRRNTLIIMSILFLLASLSWRVEMGIAQTQETVQSQEATQPVPCDGTGRSGSIQGLRRSTSNCDREAAAARTAARLAAAASGQAAPHQTAPDLNQSAPEVTSPNDTAASEAAAPDDTAAPDTTAPASEEGGNNE